MVVYALSVAESIKVEEYITFKEAIKSTKSVQWTVVVSEEMVSLYKNQIWKLVKLPVGQKIIGYKWVYKKKEGISRTEDARYKARLIAKGFTQREEKIFTVENSADMMTKHIQEIKFKHCLDLIGISSISGAALGAVVVATDEQTNRLNCFANPIELEEDPNVTESSISLTLVGKIICDKTLNKIGVRNILQKAWNPPSGLKIQEQEGRLLFTLYCEHEYQTVLQNCPWTVMGSHLALKEWPPDVALHEVKISSSPFWIRVCGLPPNRMTKNNAILIGNKIGELLKIDQLKDGKIGEKGYMRLRVEVNIEKPFPKGFAMKREGKEDAWISFQYERLPDFCFGCGHLGHVKKWCNRTINQSMEWKYAGAVRPYTPWIRASYEGDHSIPHSSCERTIPVTRGMLLSFRLPPWNLHLLIPMTTILKPYTSPLPLSTP
ncbi:hypothetical protein RJ639_009248 [Escallonia herrerae]|uniref:CCHC-type domain-containing protein n=1 Tax=Escallonia herrerae TaxID=1293975 RepID=A0AA88VPG1_9ASTE|nr:hypothetical protein RJ639_009248 [Escallonia herrerae]